MTADTPGAHELPIPEYIRTLAPYVGGKPIEELAREFGLDPSSIIKPPSTESPPGGPGAGRRAARGLGGGDG